MADDSAMKEAVTIQFMSWADIFGEVLELYNESHETQVEMAISPWSGYSEKMLTQFAGGTVAEVMWVQSTFFSMLVQRDVFAVVDGPIERDGSDVDGLVGSPWVWVSWQGKAHGIPAHGAVPRGLAYNIRLSEEAGVELPRYTDWDMNEMDAAAKAIASPPDIWGTKPTEIQRAFNEDLELMLLGDSSIDDATDSMVSKINAILADV